MATLTDPQLSSAAYSNGAMRASLSTTTPGPATPDGISEEEIALYDRQIRLWGLKAQERIRGANVLLITMKALGNEVAKNLVLAGIRSLTIVDHEVVTPADLGAQFFVEEQHVGKNRAEAASAGIRKLNPRVDVIVDMENIQAKRPSFFGGFQIVIATDLESTALEFINTATRLNNRPLYAAGCHGLYGFIFADLIEHVYVIERRPNVVTPLGPEGNSLTRTVLGVGPKPGNPDVEQVTKREVYSTWMLADGATLSDDIRRSARRLRVVTPVLCCLRALWEFQKSRGRMPDGSSHDDVVTFTTLCTSKHKALGLPPDTLKPDLLRSFLQNLGTEISPVAAVLGGQLAQDVINVLGLNQQPIQNFVIFDGNSMDAPMYALHPVGELGAKQLAASTAIGNGDPATMRKAEAEILGAAAAAMVPMTGVTQRNVIQQVQTGDIQHDVVQLD